MSIRIFRRGDVAWVYNGKPDLGALKKVPLQYWGWEFDRNGTFPGEIQTIGPACVGVGRLVDFGTRGLPIRTNT